MSTLLTPAPTAPENSSRTRWEVADIFHAYGAAYCQTHALLPEQRKAMHAITVCRTAALGGHLEQCTACGYQRPVYNSCRNRHCPKCQGLAKAQWLHERVAELLPVGYFHNVFTLPHELNSLAFANQRLVYNLLFQSVAQTLQTFAADPQHGLSGQLGFTAVLHTWDQKLLYHVHLHCLIPGGALAVDGTCWRSARPDYLFPVRALSQVFRGKFLDLLARAYRKGRLHFPGGCAGLQNVDVFQQLLDRLRHKDWVVYSQKPFAGPEKVLAYLGRYTHRIAISNHRLRDVADGQVTFTYRDRRADDQVKEITIAALEFIRRFLRHVLPAGFCRIRHFGFLANRHKQENLARCRQLLGQPPPVATPLPEEPRQRLLVLTGVDCTRCPQCQQGTMVIVERFPQPEPGSPTAMPMPAAGDDSS